MAIQTDKAVAAVFYNGTSIPIATPDTQSKTVTPTASGITVTPDTGKLLARVVVNGDVNLVPENILSGKSIFGVQGAASAGYRHDKKTLSVRSENSTITFSGLLGQPIFASCFLTDSLSIDTSGRVYNILVNVFLNNGVYSCSRTRVGTGYGGTVSVYTITDDISASYSGTSLTLTNPDRFCAESYTIEYFY